MYFTLRKKLAMTGLLAYKYLGFCCE